VDLWSRTGRGGIVQRLGRLTRLPRADWGKTIAHAGFGITMFGVVTLTGYEVEDIRVAQIGEPFEVGAYEIELLRRGARTCAGRTSSPPWRTIVVREAGTGRLIAEALRPERRIYPVAGMPTTEAGIDNGFTRDVYRHARRSAAGRRLGGADLDQALRQLDLGRDDHHGAWRAVQPFGPPLPGRRRRGQDPRRPASGAVPAE
jgi:cytochrome c biogenesis factor